MGYYFGGFENKTLIENQEFILDDLTPEFTAMWTGLDAGLKAELTLKFKS